MDLQLKKFDMRSIVFTHPYNKALGPVIVLIGKRDTGKSVLVKDLLSYHQNIPLGTVISATEAGNGFYKEIVPRTFIHNAYDQMIIASVMQRQRAVLKLIAKETAHDVKRDPRVFVILDDCLFDDKWAKDKLMRLIFLNGRHWWIMLIITMQYPLGIPPLLRTNVDYVFILRENILGNRKRIWINYAGMFPTFELFCSVLDNCTENYECLVIHTGARSNKLQDQIFWYKAEDRGSFKMGSKEYWEMSKDIGSDDEQELDPQTWKKGNGINVKKNKW